VCIFRSRVSRFIILDNVVVFDFLPYNQGFDVVDHVADASGTNASSSSPAFVLQSNPRDNLDGTPRGHVPPTLVDIDVVMADDASPVFHTLHSSTKQRIRCHFGDMRFVLCAETLQKLQSFATATFAPKEAASTSTPKAIPVTGAAPPAVVPSVRSVNLDNAHIVNLAADVEFGSLEFLLRYASGRVAGASLGGLSASVTQSVVVTTASARLVSLGLDNLLTDAGRYRTIISTEGDKVFDGRVVLDTTPLEQQVRLVLKCLALFKAMYSRFCRTSTLMRRCK
jgi:hypothetical protein